MLLNLAYSLCTSGQDVYFGVNPRTGKGGKKKNIQYFVAFHAEIDYGTDGHKKQSKYQTYEEALTAINNFSPKPTIIVHSGGGFHCYFVLTEPVKVKEVGVEFLENINKAICLELGGDIGTHDLSSILRVPGTFNNKLPGNPREVEIVNISDKKYNYEELAQRFNVSGKVVEFDKVKKRKEIIELIQSNDGQMKTKDITDILSTRGRKENTTRWMLGEMVKDGILQKPERGVYKVITNNTNITNKQIIPTIPTNSNSSISLGLIPSNFVDDNNTNNK